MTELLKTIRNKIRGETGTRIVVILGLAGMALILFSGMFTGGEKPSPQNESAVLDLPVGDDPSRRTVICRAGACKRSSGERPDLDLPISRRKGPDPAKAGPQP